MVEPLPHRINGGTPFVYHYLSEAVAVLRFILDKSNRPGNWRVMDVNPAFERLSKLTRLELIARSTQHVEDVFSQQLMQRFAEAVKSGEPTRIYHFSESTCCWRVVQAIPLPQDHQLVCIITEVDERNLSEPVGYAEYKERYRELFESMDEGFAFAEMIFDPQGVPVDHVILDTNPAYESHTGLSPEMVLGRRVTEYLDTVEPIWFEQYGEVILTGEPRRFEEYNVSLDRWFSVYAFPLRGRNRFGMVFRDITGRKLAELSLRRSEEQARALAMELEKNSKLMTDFFINISHELKTPLSILMLGIDLLEKKAVKGQGQTDIAKNIAVMRQNSYRLNRLVANLLDITKLDAGFMEPKWEHIDIVAHLALLVKSTDTFAAQKGLKLEFHSNAPNMVMPTDSFIIERIVLNLLSNAIKHTHCGGAVSVDCSIQDDGIKIAVEDNGEGIPDDKKEIIFDRFRQVDTSLSRASEGCGIGLALTKSFVELLSGSIALQSTLGVGSTFTVYLPLLHIQTTDRPNGYADDINKRIRMELSDLM